MRRRVLPTVVLSGVVALSACGGEDGNGDDGSGFAAMLDDVPAATLQGEAAPVLQYVDMDLAWERLGLADAPADERLDHLGELAQVDTYTITPSMFGNKGALVDEARSEVGFSVVDVGREIAVDAPPRTLRIADVATSPEDVESALASDPLWSDRLEAVEDDNGTYADWSGGQDFEQDLQRITPMRPLGVGGQLAVEPGDGERVTVVRTASADWMVEALAVAAGDEPSAADAGPFAGVDDALGPVDVVQAIGLATSLGGAEAMFVGADPERIEELLADYPFVDPYRAVLVAEVVDDGEPRTETLVIHADDEAAAANVEPVREMIERGRTTTSDVPITEIYPDAVVDQVGPVVRITSAGGGHFRAAAEVLYRRDVLLTR